MVLSKNTNTTAQETTITTRTTEVPGAVQQGRVLNKEAVTTNIMEKPVVENIIEKKSIEVHHKPVIQEIHEQKVIELEKQPILQNVQEEVIIEKARAAPLFEELGPRDLGEQERLRLQQLQVSSAPKVFQQQGPVQHFKESEVVTDVQRQEIIERHVQPVVTEVREQRVVQEVLEPVVRKIHEPTVIRELTYTEDSGRFHVLNTTFQPRKETIVQTQQMTVSDIQKPNMIRALTVGGKNHIYGLTYDGNLFQLRSNNNLFEWEHLLTGGILLRDISVARGGSLFGVGLNDGLLYRFNTSKNTFETVVPNDTQRLLQVSALSKRKVYAITEDGSVLYLKIPRFGTHYAWERLGGRLKKISVGGSLLRRTEIWGIGLDNRAYRLYNGEWIPFNVQLLDISVASDNAVYGVSMDGRLLKWDGSQLFNLQDREMSGDNRGYLANARLSHISAYKEGKQVYGIEQGTGNVLKMAC